ncbi:hypothetical protein [Sphingomonas sp.]|uniref:hypothetical protein n=1 Tax=Sphingomonas sp. TaxID=28214 RepID=UPI0025D42007|nr:hypothetical protein [Sphingomonas sp.]MBV9527064.1 hypothetical protein [Sphingomonas sp.]
MALTAMEADAADARAVARSSLYLGAALYCDGRSTPARIRNLSSGGALVEGAVVPEAGSLVQLVRGTLIVHGLVIWSAEGRCGLKFSGCVDVQKWRSSPTNAEQQRVDDVVRLVKAGAVPLPVAEHAESARTDAASTRGQEMAADLLRVRALLDRLADVLAEDAEVVTRHGTALQNLDISMQLIVALQSICPGEHSDGGHDPKLAGLRRSADQALNRV